MTILSRRDVLKLIPGGIPFLSPRRALPSLVDNPLPVWGTQGNRYPGTTQGFIDQLYKYRFF